MPTAVASSAPYTAIAHDSISGRRGTQSPTAQIHLPIMQVQPAREHKRLPTFTEPMVAAAEYQTWMPEPSAIELTQDSATAAMTGIAATMENSDLQELQITAEKEDDNDGNDDVDGEYVVRDSDDDTSTLPPSPLQSTNPSSPVSPIPSTPHHHHRRHHRHRHQRGRKHRSCLH